MNTLTLERNLRVMEVPVKVILRRPLVVDATTVCAVLFNTPRAEKANRLMAERSLHAPLLLDHEVAGWAARRYPGPSSEALVATAIKRYRQLEIVLSSVDMMEQYRMSLRYRLSGYQAAYMCVVARLRAPVATFHRRLDKACRLHLGVEERGQ